MKKKTYKQFMNELSQKSEIVHELSDQERKEIQNISLEIFDELIKVCEKHNLTLMLGGGSALGAVRHKGFIPWDEDIDINMPRNDFETLKTIFEKEMGENYIMYSPNYSSRPCARFAKIAKKGTSIVNLYNYDSDRKQEISIDIFVIEKIPQNTMYRFIRGVFSQGLMFAAGQVEFLEHNSFALKKFMNNSFTGKCLYNIKLILGEIFSLIPLSIWYNLIDKFNDYHGETNLRGVPTGRKHYFGEIFDKNVYFPIREGTFEGRSVNLPNNTEKYLKNLYGDYMKIPPKQHREKHFIISVNK